MNVRTWLVSLLAATPMTVAFGCVAGVGDPHEDVGVAQDEARPPQICPAIEILCIEGYKPKQLPSCNQICVPDHGFECTTDNDCGAIYCITTPCPQPVCRGHQCVLATDPPGGGGQTCGGTVCGANMYCCNASCGICAPDGGVCIQIVCSDPI